MNDFLMCLLIAVGFPLIQGILFMSLIAFCAFFGIVLVHFLRQFAKWLDPDF